MKRRRRRGAVCVLRCVVAASLLAVASPATGFAATIDYQNGYVHEWHTDGEGVSFSPEDIGSKADDGMSMVFADYGEMREVWVGEAGHWQITETVPFPGGQYYEPGVSSSYTRWQMGAEVRNYVVPALADGAVWTAWVFGEVEGKVVACSSGEDGQGIALAPTSQTFARVNVDGCGSIEARMADGSSPPIAWMPDTRPAAQGFTSEWFLGQGRAIVAVRRVGSTYYYRSFVIGFWDPKEEWGSNDVHVTTYTANVWQDVTLSADMPIMWRYYDQGGGTVMEAPNDLEASMTTKVRLRSGQSTSTDVWEIVTGYLDLWEAEPAEAIDLHFFGEDDSELEFPSTIEPTTSLNPTDLVLPENPSLVEIEGWLGTFKEWVLGFNEQFTGLFWFVGLFADDPQDKGW